MSMFLLLLLGLAEINGLPFDQDALQYFKSPIKHKKMEGENIYHVKFDDYNRKNLGICAEETLRLDGKSFDFWQGDCYINAEALTDAPYSLEYSNRYSYYELDPAKIPDARSPECSNNRRRSPACAWGNKKEPKCQCRAAQPALAALSKSTDLYCYDSAAQGDQVTVYILDSGVNFKEDFKAFEAKRFHTADEKAANKKVNFDDKNGHGTFVAGIVGSKQYGVAKNVKIVSIKISDEGSLNDIGDLFNFVIDLWIKDGRKPAVINFSNTYFESGSGWTDNTIDATEKAWFRNLRADDQLIIVASAGNDGKLAKDSLLTRFKRVISVGSVRSNGQRSKFSNWGDNVDIWAQGENIKSNYYKGSFFEARPSATDFGTSFAAPQIAGLAASLMSSGVKANYVLRTLQKNAKYQPGFKTTSDGFEDYEPKYIAQSVCTI